MEDPLHQGEMEIHKTPTFHTQAWSTRSVRGLQRPQAPHVPCRNTLIRLPSPDFPFPSLIPPPLTGASWVTSQNNNCSEILVSGSAWVGIQA